MRLKSLNSWHAQSPRRAGSRDSHYCCVMARPAESRWEFVHLPVAHVVDTCARMLMRAAPFLHTSVPKTVYLLPCPACMHGLQC